MRITQRVARARRGRGIAGAMCAMAGLVVAMWVGIRPTPSAGQTVVAERQRARMSAPQSALELARDVAPAWIPTPPTLLPARADHATEVVYFQHRKFQLSGAMTLRVTAYAPDRRCTYPYDGTTTASGVPVTANGGHLAAADTDLIPMHWLVAVPGYVGGAPVPVLDRGGAIQGRRLDVLLPSFGKAREWGVRTLNVRVYRPLD